MNKNIKKIMPSLIIATLAIVLLVFGNNNINKSDKLDYHTLIKTLETKDVKTLNIKPYNGALIVDGTINDKDDKVQKFTSVIPNTSPEYEKIIDVTETNDIKLNVKYEESGIWVSIFFNFVPLIIIVGVLYFLSKSQGGAARGLDFGKNRAKLDKQTKKVTFDDVAGCDEEKQELVELVDYLKRPAKYVEMGARIPKGVLLVGSPGTGKTLLARAVAGEANVPFYTISGSDFVELFVGVGASRVREMFKEAKLNSPCIIFIDEIDAVGRERGAGVGGGNDEREQTLNQLLVEMDGFSDNAGILMIAATNRPDVLDPALLRPGRFDRQIEVGLPDRQGRIEILKVHARNKKLAVGVTFDFIAERTPGFSGAQLENILNEAALLAVRDDKKEISLKDIDEAIDRVIGGPAKVNKKHIARELEVVAFHEAGHAVAGLVLDDAEVVQKVTIIPRGQAGGYVLMTPKEEGFLQSKTQLKNRIVGLLCGRVAEEIKFNEITTGAHNDIEKVTAIARAMVTQYGMSNLGTIQYEKQQGSVFLGRDYNTNKNFSDTVAFEIDKEVKDIVDECYQIAKDLLIKNRSLHELIGKTLMEKETLTKEEIYALYEENKNLTQTENIA